MPSEKTHAIRNKIAEIRRTPARALRAHERREKVTQLVIQNLKTSGSFFKTPQGHFYFNKGQAPRLYPIERDSVALSALIEDRYGL